MVEGAGNLPREPAILVCRHASMWEAPALRTLVAPQAWLLKVAVVFDAIALLRFRPAPSG